MDKVYTLDGAGSWFLHHSEGNVICVHDKTGVELECGCYPRAERFYNSPGLPRITVDKRRLEQHLYMLRTTITEDGGDPKKEVEKDITYLQGGIN